MLSMCYITVWLLCHIIASACSMAGHYSSEDAIYRVSDHSYTYEYFHSRINALIQPLTVDWLLICCVNLPYCRYWLLSAACC